jgi:hypothetical protein
VEWEWSAELEKIPLDATNLVTSIVLRGLNTTEDTFSSLKCTDTSESFDSIFTGQNSTSVHHRSVRY